MERFDGKTLKQNSQRVFVDGRQVSQYPRWKLVYYGMLNWSSGWIGFVVEAILRRRWEGEK